jgi:hypothetical protein
MQKRPVGHPEQRTQDSDVAEMGRSVLRPYEERPRGA